MPPRGERATFLGLRCTWLGAAASVARGMQSKTDEGVTVEHGTA